MTQVRDVSQGARPYVAEFLYGRSVMAGAGELGLFGRAMNRATALDGAVRPELVAGARFNVSY